MNSTNSKSSDTQRLIIFQIKYVQRGLILSGLKILQILRCFIKSTIHGKT